MSFFRLHEEPLIAGVQPAVFVFVMTALVYETQRAMNPKIADYADALYFTLATLTTTKFGDITLEDKFGELLSVFIMVCGVTLFYALRRRCFACARYAFPAQAAG